jgi:hypothetical protein
VKASGIAPETGTYSLTPLEGENGTEMLCIGSKVCLVSFFFFFFFFFICCYKAFDDTRHYYHILSVMESDPKTAIWGRGQFPAKYKPFASEGMTCHVCMNHVLVIGGRPGETEKDYIDFMVIPRDQFVSEKKPSALSSGNLGSPMASRKSIGVSASSSALSGANSKRNTAASKTVSSRSTGVTKKDDLRSLFASNDSEAYSSVRDLLSSSKSAVSKDATSPEALSPRGDADTMAQFHQAFDLEVSRRLDSENKAQSLAREVSALKEAYALLQTETQRLYQLAMSEVTTPAGREKLERRYDELRSASSEILVVNEPVKVSKEKSFFSVASKGPSKRDKLMEHHLACVDKVNIDANKLLRPILSAAAVAAASSSTSVPQLQPAASAPSAPSTAAPAESSTQAAKITKALPIPKRKNNDTTSPILSPRESDEGPSSPPTSVEVAPTASDVPDLPANLSDIWASPELAAEFETYVRNELPDQFANVLFCQAVYRLTQSPPETHTALIEGLVMDHLTADAELLVTGLDQDMREGMIEDSNSRWLETPPDESYWLTVLRLVETVLRPAYSTYLTLAGQSADKRRQHMSLSRRPGGSSGHHQLVATAETQLMERLAEMGKEGGSGTSGAAEAGEEKDSYLFKKVTSEMVATEINYVTDLKGKKKFVFSSSSSSFFFLLSSSSSSSSSFHNCLQSQQRFFVARSPMRRVPFFLWRPSIFLPTLRMCTR